LHTQVGRAAPEPWRHCATRGELHDISQRLPPLSALHEVVPRVAELVTEFVDVVVLPAFVELVTLVEFVALTELLTSVALLESVELVASVDTAFSAEPHAHKASASTVTRSLMGRPPMLSMNRPSAAPSVPHRGDAAALERL
jgi:hypothetical protein